MRSTSVTAAAATVFIVHFISALSASLITIRPGTYSLSEHLPALNASFPTNVRDANIVSIEECGDGTGDVQRAFNLARAAANVAIADVVRGAHSPFGFNAMFKRDMSKNAVSYYLNMIYNAKGLRDLRPDMAHATPPRLACVQQNSAMVYQGLHLGYDPWQRCMHRWRRQRSPRQSFYGFGTAYIFLCPSFHEQALAPTGNHCPTVVGNKFAGDVAVFYRQYQMYTLMYELIRFYLQTNALGARSVPKEVFDWNQCVALSTESSLKNPTNILLYIALAQQWCLEAPNPSEPPFAPRSQTTTPSASNIW